MPYITYKTKKISPERLAIIAQANQILDEFDAQGFNMTLRQLYYKFVARDLFPESWIDRKYNLKHGLAPDTKNTVKNYKRFGDIVADGRLCGLIDWDRMEDRTRNLERLSAWNSPADMIESSYYSYHRDRWRNQPYRVELWCEKEALIGIFAKVCNKWDIPYFACRGYVSLSEVWQAAQRLDGYIAGGQQPVILHFGDHDPSGIDMTRDIRERLETFGVAIDVDRLALNMDQIEDFTPPPNPAKMTDARFKKYVIKYGPKSWELDALDPAPLISLAENAIHELRDEKKWRETIEQEIDEKARLRTLSRRWPEVSKHVGTKYKVDLAESRKTLRSFESYKTELNPSEDEEEGDE